MFVPENPLLRHSPTPIGSVGIVSDDFPLLHLELLLILERLRRTANTTTSSTTIPAPMSPVIPIRFTADSAL